MEEKQRVALAVALKAMNENWVDQTEIIRLKARLAWTRYTHLTKIGFTEDQALRLCLEDVQIQR